MKIHALIFAAITACFSVGASAAGNPHDHRGDRYERHDGRHGGSYRGDYRRDHGYRGHHRQQFQHYDRHRDRHHFDYGDRPYRHHHHRHLRRGDYFPPAYCGHAYHVIDWRRAHLGPPMHGCYWVRLGNDYLQVSAVSGRVIAVVLRP